MLQEMLVQGLQQEMLVGANIPQRGAQETLLHQLQRGRGPASVVSTSARSSSTQHQTTLLRTTGSRVHFISPLIHEQHAFRAGRLLPTGRCDVFVARWASVAAKTVNTRRQVRTVSNPHALARLTPSFSLFAAPSAAAKPPEST